MDGKREYTQAEIDAAWEAAEVIPDQDPSNVRVDNVFNAGVYMYRERFGAPEGYQQKGGYWVIDEQGRARHAGHKLKDLAHSARAQIKRAEDGIADERRARNEEKAAAAGLPNSEIFDRLDALEQAVQRILQDGGS